MKSSKKLLDPEHNAKQQTICVISSVFYIWADNISKCKCCCIVRSPYARVSICVTSLQCPAVVIPKRLFSWGQGFWKNVLIRLDSLALCTVGPTAVGNTRWGEGSYSYLDHAILTFCTDFFFPRTNLFSPNEMDPRCQRVCYMMFFSPPSQQRNAQQQDYHESQFSLNMNTDQAALWSSGNMSSHFQICCQNCFCIARLNIIVCVSYVCVWMG